MIALGKPQPIPPQAISWIREAIGSIYRNALDDILTVVPDDLNLQRNGTVVQRAHDNGRGVYVHIEGMARQLRKEYADFARERSSLLVQTASTRICTPRARRVMRGWGVGAAPGTGRRRQRRASVARASTPSIHANPSPMHLRGPPPKGK